MLIGELSKHSKFSRDTIRYYERLGLIVLGKESKAENGYKNYSQDALERLRQIQRLKEVGFTLSEIYHLLRNDGNRHVCLDLPQRLTEKLFKIDGKIAELMHFKESLLKIQQACSGSCSTHNGLPECVPLSAKGKKAAPCC